MASWFHATILATGLAATVAVGFASASMLNRTATAVAAKGDRLAAVVADKSYQTVETRSPGVSILTRIQVD
jgi:hypothetical protein